MKSPFVSRERLDDAQRLLAESEAERRRLLDLLLASPVPARPIAVAVATSEADKPAIPARKEGDGGPIPFTTPLDRVLARFDQAHKIGTLPQSSFKAKMH